MDQKPGAGQYDLSSGTPTVPVATLHNPSPAADDNFGTSVAIDGTTVAIGTPLDDTTTADKGAAYVFTPAPCLTVPSGTTTTLATGGTFDCLVIEDGGTLILGGPPNAPAQIAAASASPSATDKAVLPDLIPATEAIPFPEGQGIYGGLLDSGIPGRALPSVATFTVTRKGRFTGTIRYEDRSYRLSGRFDPLGRFAGAARHPGHASLAVVLKVDPAGGTGRMTGTISAGGRMTDFLADRAGFSAKNNPAPQAGIYTAELLPNVNGKPSLPGGGDSGYGLVRVLSSGAVRFVGRLPDGTPISAGTRLSKQGLWPSFITPHRSAAGGFSWIVSFPE